ncbi:MAG: YraN family protein [Terriglobia bacterium]
MSLGARIVYAAVAWKERRQALAAAPAGTDHLGTGRRGETLAYWFLRCNGYTMVARNLRVRQGVGELDLVGWDGRVLAFIEVKTRTGEEFGAPELAVGLAQQQRIAEAAQFYVRRLKRKAVNYRFDIVSVAWHAREGYRLKIIKDAFKGLPASAERS